MKIDPEALYQQLGHLLAATPNFENGEWSTPEGQQWLGRAFALVKMVGDPLDVASIKVASNNLGNAIHKANAQTIVAVLYRALATAELAAPSAAQGSFIPVGESFTALSSVSKVLGAATKSVMFVDGYADANLLIDYAVLASDGVSVLVIADQADYKAGLQPAAEHWGRQYGQARPLEVRLAPPKTLHDRLLILDSRDVFTLGQSFNALAKRSPTSLVRVDPDTASRKVDAYDKVWGAAVPLV